jgi:hypothetical protein
VPAVEVDTTAIECPPLAPLPADAPESQRALVPLVEAMRAVSCAPEIFGQPLPVARQTLSLPDAMPFDLGRRYARFELGEAPVLVTDLLAVAGIADAKLRMRDGFSPVWVVGTGPEATDPTPWGPGVVRIYIGAPRHNDTPHGGVVEIPADATLDDAVVISMPEPALRYADDPHAAALLAAALTKLAEQPAVLDEEPERARATLDGLGERYELHRYSEGLGETKAVGFSIRPHRTELVAADFAKALGLGKAAHEAIRITDTNPNRLSDAGETPFVWRGLRLEVELDEREGGDPHIGLGRWVVSDLQVLPAAK